MSASDALKPRPGVGGLHAAICQPHYLPWIGYLAMIDAVDTFVFLDDVQFVRREWKNRNRIRKTPRGGDTKWLTVPVVKDPWPGKPIRETRIRRDHDWFAEHRRALQAVYARAPRAERLHGLLERLAPIASAAEDLATLNIETTRELCRELGITTRLVRASDFAVGGQKTERLLALLEALGAGRYLANDASRVYLDVDLLAAHGISTSFQGYVHPEYVQAFGGERLPFLSHLSVLDLLANAGEEARGILRGEGAGGAAAS